MLSVSLHLELRRVHEDIASLTADMNKEKVRMKKFKKKAKAGEPSQMTFLR